MAHCRDRRICKSAQRQFRLLLRRGSGNQHQFTPSVEEPQDFYFVQSLQPLSQVWLLIWRQAHLQALAGQLCLPWVQRLGFSDFEMHMLERSLWTLVHIVGFHLGQE